MSAIEEDLRRHALNYVLIKSGVRDYCSQCGGCCTVCDSMKKQPFGCRNDTCLLYICGSLNKSLPHELKDFISSLEHLCRYNLYPLQFSDLSYVKHKADFFSNSWIESLHYLQETVNKLEKCPHCKRYMDGNSDKIELKGCKNRYSKRINKALIERAKEFDKVTMEIFKDVK